MESDTCRRPTCDNPNRHKSDDMTGYSAKFCSQSCEMKFDHIKADAADARRDPEPRGVPDRDLPERDGPPY